MKYYVKFALNVPEELRRKKNVGWWDKKFKEEEEEEEVAGWLMGEVVRTMML